VNGRGPSKFFEAETGAVRTKVEAVNEQSHAIFGKAVGWYVQPAFLSNREVRILIQPRATLFSQLLDYKTKNIPNFYLNFRVAR
jgi:hypothetical protein